MRPLVERILADRLGAEVSPGDWVTPQVDRIMVHDGTGPTMARALALHGITDLTAVDKLVVVFDHYFPPTGPREAALHDEARVFCRTHEVPLYEGQGIAHQLLPERGLVGPGQIYVGADSHTCTAGALGALAIGLGATDVAAVVASGRVWMEVPETLQVRLDDSYVFYLGDPGELPGAPPTFRQWFTDNGQDVAQAAEEWELEPGGLDRQICDEHWVETWSLGHSSMALGFHYLSSLDLGPQFGTGGDGAAGEIRLADCPSMCSSYRAAETDDLLSISLLQNRLNELGEAVLVDVSNIHKDRWGH